MQQISLIFWYTKTTSKSKWQSLTYLLKVLSFSLILKKIFIYVCEPVTTEWMSSRNMKWSHFIYILLFFAFLSEQKILSFSTSYLSGRREDVGVLLFSFLFYLSSCIITWSIFKATARRSKRNVLFLFFKHIFSFHFFFFLRWWTCGDIFCKKKYFNELLLTFFAWISFKICFDGCLNDLIAMEIVYLKYGIIWFLWFGSYFIFF